MEKSLDPTDWIKQLGHKYLLVCTVCTYPFQKTCADFRSFGVQSDSQRVADSKTLAEVVDSSADILDGLAVILIASVAEIQTSHIHSGFDHLLQHSRLL